MSIHKLFAILVAIAVLFAPAFTGTAAAAAVPDHHGQAMEQGHCDPAPAEDQDDSTDMSCCGATCMAVAIAPSAILLGEPLIGSVRAASLQAFQAGTPAELATPPPRTA